MRKPMLSVDQLISHMQSKNITFAVMDVDDEKHIWARITITSCYLLIEKTIQNILPENGRHNMKTWILPI